MYFKVIVAAMLITAVRTQIPGPQFPGNPYPGGRIPGAPFPGAVPPVVPGQRPVPGLVGPGGLNPYYNGPGVAIPILSYSNNQLLDGSYEYSFSTADGKSARESGYLRDQYINNNGEPEGIQVKEGSYSYTAPDGSLVQVTYIADENGFRIIPPEGSLPPRGPSAIPTPGFRGPNLPRPDIVNGLNNPFDPNLGFNRRGPLPINYPQVGKQRFEPGWDYNRRYNRV